MKKTYKILNTYICRDDDKIKVVKVIIRPTVFGEGDTIEGIGVAIRTETDPSDSTFGIKLARKRALQDALITLQQQLEQYLRKLETAATSLKFQYERVRADRAYATKCVHELVDSTKKPE